MQKLTEIQNSAQMLNFSLYNTLEGTIWHHFTFLFSQICNLSRDCYHFACNFSESLVVAPLPFKRSKTAVNL